MSSGAPASETARFSAGPISASGSRPQNLPPLPFIGVAPDYVTRTETRPLTLQQSAKIRKFIKQRGKLSDVRFRLRNQIFIPKLREACVAKLRSSLKTLAQLHCKMLACGDFGTRYALGPVEALLAGVASFYHEVAALTACAFTSQNNARCISRTRENFPARKRIRGLTAI